MTKTKEKKLIRSVRRFMEKEFREDGQAFKPSCILDPESGCSVAFFPNSKESEKFRTVMAYWENIEEYVVRGAALTYREVDTERRWEKDLPPAPPIPFEDDGGIMPKGLGSPVEWFVSFLLVFIPAGIAWAFMWYFR